MNIALNKITGEWNKELLADLIMDLQESDFDVNLTGFDPPEIEQLMSSVHDKDIEEDDFDIDVNIFRTASVLHQTHLRCVGAFILHRGIVPTIKMVSLF